MQVNRAALQTPHCTLAGQSPPPGPPHWTTGWLKTPDYVPTPVTMQMGKLRPRARKCLPQHTQATQRVSDIFFLCCLVPLPCQQGVSQNAFSFTGAMASAEAAGWAVGWDRRPGRARWVEQGSREPCTCLLPLWEKFHSLSFSCLFPGAWG